MGLITKEVEVGLCSKNIDYYEKLGYEIPRYYNKNSCTWRVKRSTKIIVDIKHISPYARYKVDVDCDCCGKHLSIPYQQYNTNKHDDKYYCVKCGTSIFNSGKNNPSWNSNLTDEERITKRQYPEYNEFTKRVLLRDEYTCKCCEHTKTEYRKMHKKYENLKINYSLQTNLHQEALATYVRFKVKEEDATARGDVDEAKKWYDAAQNAAANGKLTPKQLSEADLQGGINSFSEIFKAVEQAVDVIPILPRFKYRPNDALDFNIYLLKQVLHINQCQWQ